MKRTAGTFLSRPERTWYAITLVVLAAVIVGACYTIILLQKKLLLTEKQNEIATIADLKSYQLVQWRKERFAEGASIRANSMIARRINDYLSGHNSNQIKQEIDHWLASLIDLGEYSSALLFSANGSLLTAQPARSGQLNDHYYLLTKEATSDHELILSDFHSDGPGDPYDLNMAIPIMSPETGEPHCIAVLIFDIDPTKRLYPLIQSWPATSSSAETLLVTRLNDSVLFLNNHRHQPATAPPFQAPLTRTDMPAVKAALGFEGSYQGTDYRNIPVVSAIRIIPGTRWGLVAKIDTSEVLAPLTTGIAVVSGAGIILMISMIMGLFLWGARRKAETLNKLVAIEQKYNQELKASEESLTKSRDYHYKLLEIFPSLIWRSGTDAKCDYFNQTWLAFTGRSLENELGDGWLDGIHPEDHDNCLAAYNSAFAARQEFIIEYRLRFHDGSYRWINDHGRPYYDQDGIFAGFIGSCYDINMQKRAEEELQKIHAGLEQQIVERTKDLSEINTLLRLEITERQQLEQQLLTAKRLEAIGQIAGGVAHEVRNPLNAILTITEALFREQEILANPEYEPYILHIRTQVGRLVSLMNDLLDLGRTIPATNMQPIPLGEVCQETLKLWQATGLVRNKQALLTTDLDYPGVMVIADALKLQQIFFNLLENAGYHTPPGNTITLKLTRSTNHEDADMALVQVIDQGCGVTEETLPYIFDPFFTSRQGGTGLGLALVKHFIENMGGAVQIFNNTPPPGCTVEVKIPLSHKETP